MLIYPNGKPELELVNCIRCGSPASEPDFSEVTEGMTYAKYGIECSSENTEICPMYVMVEADLDTSTSVDVENKLRQCWNILNTQDQN